MYITDLSNPQTRICDVLTGEIQVAEGNALLRCSGIGSCICVVLIDRDTDRGAVSHVMLPGTAPECHTGEQNRYARNAVKNMIAMLEDSGSRADHLIAVIAGGGNVLRKPGDTICSMNICSVKQILMDLNIGIVAESTGGTKRRAVSFFPGRKEVYCSEGDGPECLLYALPVPQNQTT